MPSEPRKRPSRGAIVVPAKFGDAFGTPFQNVAYITPRYPDGIKDSALKQLDQAIQRETALWWFLLNFERYDLSRGGPYFGFSDAAGELPTSGAIGQGAIGKLVIGGGPEVAGWDQGRWAPNVFQAPTILRSEFGDTLRDEVAADLADALPGDWMWRIPLSGLSDSTPHTMTEILAALVPILVELIVELGELSLPPTHGGMGHNSSGAAVPPNELMRDELIADIIQVKAAAESAEGSADSTIRTIWATISPKLAAFGLWTFDRLNDFFTEASKEAGKKAGTVGIIAVGAFVLDPHISLHSLFLEADHLISLLGTL